MPNAFAMAPAYPAFTTGEKAVSTSASSKLSRGRMLEKSPLAADSPVAPKKELQMGAQLTESCLVNMVNRIIKKSPKCMFVSPFSPNGVVAG